MAYVNTETGEWSLSPTEDSKFVKHKVKDYVGVDTRFPSDCKDTEELLKVVKNIDPYINNKTYINTNYILDCIIKGYLTPKGAESLNWVCNQIVCWNYVFTTKSDLINQGFTSSPHYAKWVNSMAPFLTVSKVHMNNKEMLKIKVNPHVAWKGDRLLQEGAVQSYYASASI